MPVREQELFADVASERELAMVETSTETFDRFAFAMRALDLIRVRRTRVAICEGRSRVRVESGRAWGRAPGERWAVLSIPKKASRRAIALAVSELASDPPGYALEVLLGDHEAADSLDRRPTRREAGSGPHRPTRLEAGSGPRRPT
jgi:hypothetical protein